MHNEVQHSIVHGNEVPHPPMTSWQDRAPLTAELEDLLRVHAKRRSRSPTASWA